MVGELLRVGPVVIYSYGTALAASFLIGTALATGAARQRGVDAQLIMHLSVRVLVVALVVGRLGYCLPDLWFYLTHPLELWQVPPGGISYMPAIAGALIYVRAYARRRSIQLWPLLDVLAPGLAVGLIVGTLGAIEAQSEMGAWSFLGRYWAPPVLAFFSLEYAGLWYLSASRRRLPTGARFCQIVALDGLARLASSAWAWALYGVAPPHVLSVAAGGAMCAWAVWQMRVLRETEQSLLQAAGEMAAANEQTIARRRRPPVRERLLHAAVWLTVYLLFVLMLGSTPG